MAKPNLVEAAEAFSRKYEDVFGDKDPQDIMDELRGCQPAARGAWMEAAMEEIALLYIRSVVTKEQVDGVAVIARHYAQHTAAEIAWLRKERHRHVEQLEAAERDVAAKDAEIAGLNANLSCLRDQTRQDGKQMVRLRRELNEMQDLLAQWRPRAEAAERERDEALERAAQEAANPFHADATLDVRDDIARRIRALKAQKAPH